MNTSKPDTKHHLLVIYTNSKVSRHFWHFMMGEFFPVSYTIMEYADANVDRKIDVQIVMDDTNHLKCPLNSFYKELEEVIGGNRLTITWTQSPPPPSATAGLYTKVTTRYLQRWDWEWRGQHEPRKLLKVVNRLKQWARNGLASTTDMDAITCIVQTRENATNSAQVKFLEEHGKDKRQKISGHNRRNVGNLRDIATTLANEMSPTGNRHIKIVSDDGKTLKQQIQTYLDANALVLGHGAGMLHTLWMKPHSRILEIISRDKCVQSNGAVQGLVRLSTVLGFQLERIVVQKEICTLEGPKKQQLRTFVTNALTQPPVLHSVPHLHRTNCTYTYPLHQTGVHRLSSIGRNNSRTESATAQRSRSHRRSTHSSVRVASQRAQPSSVDHPPFSTGRKNSRTESATAQRSRSQKTNRRRTRNSKSTSQNPHHTNHT
jgi:hypothetical protein